MVRHCFKPNRRREGQPPRDTAIRSAQKKTPGHMGRGQVMFQPERGKAYSLPAFCCIIMKVS